MEQEIFNVGKPYTQLNFPDEGGVTGYFSSNMTKQDLALVKAFLDEQHISVLNTRAFKEDGKYVVTVGSIKTDGTRTGIDFQGHQFDVVYGEFAPYLVECNHYLQQALKYCANEN